MTDSSAVPATTDRDAERPLTDRSRAEFESAIAAVLRANGLVGAPETPEQAEEGIHSWRCGYPGIYGPEVCTCFSELVEELADLMGDGLADAWDEGYADAVAGDTCRCHGNPYRCFTDDGEDA